MFGYWLQHLIKVLISVPSLVLVALLGGWFSRNRWPRRARALFSAGFVLLAVALFPPLPELLVSSLRTEAEVRAGSADAIVVLGGDGMRGADPGPVTAERTARGAALFNQGVAPLLLVTGGGPQKDPDVRALGRGMARLAQQLGVPPEAILVEDRSLDTRQNATLSQPLLAARGVKRIVLVTSPTHLRRSAMVFSALGFEVLPVASQPAPRGWGFAPSFERAGELQSAVREWIGIAWYRLRSWI